jgi:hypothetical protein
MGNRVCSGGVSVCKIVRGGGGLRTYLGIIEKAHRSRLLSIRYCCALP